jgi:proline iminopeptidase
MPEPFPPIEPYDHGMLDVGDGHRVYWEVCGNPDGKPALVLHGGPGSGCTPSHRRLFDPELYRIVLFDQRNCGRSTPHASDPAVDLSTNTTGHLLADIETLRRHLGVEKWMLFGQSWGVTLGTAYALHHPDRVSECVFASITTTRPSEIHWLYHGAGQFFPDEWYRFREGAKNDDPNINLVEAYHRLLNDTDAAVREEAARYWCEWEDAIVAVTPKRKWNPRYDDPAFRLCFARIVTHYFRHQAWLDDAVLLQNAPRLRHIPAILIHGRQDISSPFMTAWALAKSWPGAELIGVHDAGHGTPMMREHILNAIALFAY